MKKHRDPYPKYVKRNMKYLEFHRKNRFMTQTKLANLLLVPRTRISAWERNEYLPSQKKYNELAEIFDWEKWE